jgi:hypothetical protein
VSGVQIPLDPFNKMDFKKKRQLTNLIFVLIFVLILLGFFIYTNKDVEEETAKCIGDNSLLYIQEGCSHCETQENMFGENFKYINTVDCTITPQDCSGIIGTPSWKIDGELYSGVQSIKRLKELTGC